jgi:excisionase family DNA binding protein
MRALMSSVSRNGSRARETKGTTDELAGDEATTPRPPLITRSSIWSEGGRSSASAAHSGRPRTPDHRSMREEAPDTQKESKMIMEQLLTTEELAKRMRVNPSTVRRWRQDDVGPPYLRVGTVYRYPISAVEAWIAESVRGSIAS